MKIKDLCEDERPREKMLDKGTDALSNAELMAILLRTGTEKMNVVDVAREVLKSGEGKLNEVAAMSVDVLCRINGIGPSKAVTLAAAFELGRRCATETATDTRTTIRSPKDVFRMMLPLLKGLDHEECWVLFLNRANILTGKEIMSKGGLESTIIDCKMIAKRAMEKKASSIILVHNHPSGSALPGEADIKQTGTLKRALATCDISLLDHVIIADDSYYSFADEQLEKA